jgi:hypothetical protein
MGGADKYWTGWNDLHPDVQVKLVKQMLALRVPLSQIFCIH